MTAVTYSVTITETIVDPKNSWMDYISIVNTDTACVVPLSRFPALHPLLLCQCLGCLQVSLSLVLHLTLLFEALKQNNTKQNILKLT